MTTRVHPDEDPLDVAHVVGLERTDVPAGFTARALSDDQPVWVDYAEDDLVAFLNTRLDRDGMVIIEITRP